MQTQAAKEIKHTADTMTIMEKLFSWTFYSTGDILAMCVLRKKKWSMLTGPEKQA